jgi:hypothetical protein
MVLVSSRMIPLSILAAVLAGCGVTQAVRDDIAIREPIAKDLVTRAPERAISSNVIEVAGARLGITEVNYTKNKGVWLKQKTFSYKAPTAVPLSQVIAAISAKGVNFVNDMPIDNVTFTGSVPMTDVETALRQILGSVGLDYSVDDPAKLVTIQPLPTRTWTLPIRERTSSFSSSGQSNGSQAGAGNSSQGNSNQGTASSSQGGSGSSSQGGAQGSNGAQTAQNGAGGSDNNGLLGSSQAGSFSASDSPWAKLQSELNDRLFVMVPNPRVSAQQGAQPNIPTPMGAGPLPTNYGGATSAYPSTQGGIDNTTSGAELYVKKRIGHYALNPNTGAVTVSAPHWILNSLDQYFRRTADSLNTQISIKGIMILVSKSKSNSEGVDLQGFATWAAGRYGAVVSNNALGGVTVNFPNGNIPSVTAGSPTLRGPLVGVMSLKDGVSMFNNYMQQFGNTYTVQEPRIATTSGVAGKFYNYATDLYTRVSQNTSAGTTGSAVQGNNNEIVTIKLGTELSVYPTYDPVTGIVRALIISKSTVKDGQKTLPQFLAAGTTQQQINQTIPLTRDLAYEGEALMRDGDLIVFGGQTEESMQSDEAGLPGPNGPFGGVLGTKSASRSGGTYYFALKVSISKL